MTEAETATSKSAGARERRHDRLISLLLAAIWFLAVYLVWQSDIEIPASMLLVGTAFFIMLIPAMKELVKALDKRLRAELGLGETIEDQE